MCNYLYIDLQIPDRPSLQYDCEQRPGSTGLTSSQIWTEVWCGPKTLGSSCVQVFSCALQMIGILLKQLEEGSA